MQLDDRWPTHLLTTLRALLGAAASFLFGQPEFFYLGQHLSLVLLGQISKAKWLKEHTVFILFLMYHRVWISDTHSSKSEKATW